MKVCLLEAGEVIKQEFSASSANNVFIPTAEFTRTRYPKGIFANQSYVLSSGVIQVGVREFDLRSIKYGMQLLTSLYGLQDDTVYCLEALTCVGDHRRRRCSRCAQSIQPIQKSTLYPASQC